VVCVVLLAGCATPEVKEPSRTRILDPDQEDDTGGTFLESSDVRTIAQQMTSGLLSTPAIAGHGETARIALAPVRNSTRFLIDSDIFLTRLRIELNRVSEGRVRFFMQDHAQQVRRQILREGDQTGWEAAADEIAGHVLQSVRRSDRPGPVRMAVGSVKNTNITGMNAESFLALLRARLAEQSGGRVVFVSEPVSQRAQQALANRAATTDLGVDYLLGGEFIAQSIQVAEGKKEVELRLKQKTEVFGQTYTKENTDEETLKFEARQNPNVTKWFNCQVVNGADGTIFCEKMVSLEARVASGLSAADFILTGEIRALSKSSQGAYKSDYVIVSFQLVDPRSNEVLWEDAYESKRASQVGTVYR
jgi:TolB-like protein